MQLRISLVVLVSLVVTLLVFTGCTDTPAAPSVNSQQNCPDGQQFDSAENQCVAINGGDNDPNNGTNQTNQTPNQTPNQQPGVNQNPGDLPPWGDAGEDGIPNQYDNCPFHYNPDQTDTSGDGVGDVCDNCPNVANPDQAYSLDNPVDDRGIIMGDACAPGVIYADTITDSSGDGVPDIMDNCPDHWNPPLTAGCSCPSNDPYCAECICQCPDNMYPCDGCEQLDSSGDGVGDACDVCPEQFNPNQTVSPGNPTWSNRFDGDGNPLRKGDSCSPEPINIPICGEQDTEFEQLMPSVYIALDLSGSMSNSAPSGRSRIDEALDGMDLIAEQLHDEIRFGLGTFPHYSDGGCLTAHVRDVGTYTEFELKNTWSSYVPLGLTPMYQIMNDILVNNRLDDPSDPFDDDRLKAVLLITDGVANCAASGVSGNAQEQVEGVIEQLYDAGVLTFVVGFDIQDDSLEAYANAGGTGAGTEFGGHFLANEAQGLADSMREVADLLVSCTYSLNPAPEDPNKIWVQVDGQYYLDRDEFSYDVNENLLTFTDEACEEVRAVEADQLSVTIKMGCASQCVAEEPQGLCDMWYETCGGEICEPCSPEICDGTDNNCSGVVDDNCPECQLYQQTCETTADCCEPFVCQNGICDRECYPVGAPCRSNSDCCQTCALDGEIGQCIEN